jgi:hypothetical protein
MKGIALSNTPFHCDSMNQIEVKALKYLANQFFIQKRFPEVILNMPALFIGIIWYPLINTHLTQT